MKSIKKIILTSLLIPLFSAAAPSDTNFILERVARDTQIPPIILKAIAWQESGWTHLVNGRTYVSSDGGVGIMQIQNGDRTLNEENNIRSGANALMNKWQLNVSPAAQKAMKALGAIDEDFRIDILENWWTPLAAYNGYSGSNTDGSGGGKGYARALFGLIANPNAYTNYRPSPVRAASVSTAYLPFFNTKALLSDPFKFIPNFTGGTAAQIQAYTLCDLVKNKGKVHRYDYATQNIVEVTADISKKCGVSAVAGAKVINTPSIPTQLAQNGKLAFTVQLDKPADQVKIVFQNPQAEVALAGQGTAWSLQDRQITTAGSRPWAIQIISGGQVTDAHVTGTLNVVADIGLPPPSNPTMQSAQVSGLAQEGRVSTFIFNGRALSDSVLVTIANCDNPKTELVNASQIKHSCIPRVAGALAAGWKPNSSTVTPVSLGSVSVLPAQFDSPPPPSILTAEQLGRMVLGANYATVTQPYLARYDRAPVEPSGVIGTGYHPGIDYRAAVGTDVLSPVNGVVTAGGGGAFGTITIHMEGSQNRVLLMHTSSSYVKAGDRVMVGCIVGKSGKAGTDAPHLHVETRTGRDGGAFYFKSPANVGVNLNPLSVIRGFVTPPARPVICGRSDQSPPPGSTNAMSFLGETVPDGTIQNASSQFNKTWTLKNTGTTTWDSSYCLRPVSGDALAPTNTTVCVENTKTVSPNASYTFIAAMTAPAAKTTDASYKQVWALSKAGAAAFGTQVSAQIIVKGQVGTPNAPALRDVQVNGTAQINTPSIFLFNGQNLNSSVVVTIANCENPKSELMGLNQLKHTCVPRASGAQPAGWKPTSATASPIALGNVVIQDARNAIGGGTLATKVDSFVNAWRGKRIDFDKRYDYQCVDLMRQYAQDVLGMNNQFPIGHAYAIFNSMNSTATLKKVLNSPSAVPNKGDVIFWHPAPSNGQAGHVGIFVSGDANQFTSFDQNYCSNAGSGVGDCAPRLVSHNYTGVAGWITTNTASLPPPPPVALNIQSFGTSAPTVAVNQNLTFNVAVDNPAAVDRVNLVFPTANVNEAMTQVAGGASWTRTRTMSTVGNNLAYEVWVYKKGDAANPIKRSGTYSVTAAPPTAQDGMSFVSGSLAQNTVVNPQSSFSASWTLRNTGNTTWNSQYCLKPKGNAGVNAGNFCVNGTVAPNAQVTFNSINLQSPAASTSDQIIRQDWELFNSSNAKVGDAVWVQVVVKAKAAPAPVQPPPPAVQPTPPVQPKPVTPPPSACTTTGAKVCGTNGVTYSNACLMREAGATLRKAGAC